jgi:hypothetical protein
MKARSIVVLTGVIPMPGSLGILGRAHVLDKVHEFNELARKPYLFSCGEQFFRGSVQVRLNRGIPGVTHPWVADRIVWVNAVSTECIGRGR